MCLYCCCARAQEDMSEREMAVHVLTDNLKMNAEGGGEELHTYKMYPFTYSACL